MSGLLGDRCWVNGVVISTVVSLALLICRLLLNSSSSLGGQPPSFLLALERERKRRDGGAVVRGGQSRKGTLDRRESSSLHNLMDAVPPLLLRNRVGMIWVISL